MTTPKKKLIEVALPLDAINRASAREKSIRQGHPSGLHLWWARRPLAAARAVLFAQLVDDPSAHPDLFQTPKAQEKERLRLFRIIENLVEWENTSNSNVVQAARNEIWQSWRAACAENVDHPRAKDLFDRKKLPAFHDPFAGGGTIPLEAQRLGLMSTASDLNPVAVFINKAMIEVPPRFAGRPPVNGDARKGLAKGGGFSGSEGLAEDIRYYGEWMRSEAERRIGHLYPAIEITKKMVEGRPDLQPLVGSKQTIVAWLWARTVKSPNPAFAAIEVPLASTFMLSAKPGREYWVEPSVERHGYSFVVRTGKPPTDADAGTKLGRGSNFKCLMSGAPVSGDYIKAEGMAGRIGTRLLAAVIDGGRGRIYLSPTPEMEDAARRATPTWKPEGDVPSRLTGGTCVPYGFKSWGDLFTARQLVALTTFSDLVGEAQKRVLADAHESGWAVDEMPLREDGAGAQAYAQAIAVYLSCVLSSVVDDLSSNVTWRTTHGTGATRSTFARQALPMVWDFAEANPFASAAGDLESAALAVARVVRLLPVETPGSAAQADAATQDISRDKIVSTDPPYYNNIGYADLSDFFYVWLRRALRPVFPELFSTMVVPKAEELVAAQYRHGGKDNAEAFFLDGMTRAMHRLAEQAHPGFPITIYYAFKQAESESDAGTASTGWETFLDAVNRAGLAVTGTWPMRTERSARSVGIGTNALASSIVLVCRCRASDAPVTTRRDFLAALKAELPEALTHLQRGNIAPVDLAQAAIGPGMAVYTRFSKVLDAQGQPMPVRDALERRSVQNAHESHRLHAGDRQGPSARDPLRV